MKEKKNFSFCFSWMKWIDEINCWLLPPLKFKEFQIAGLLVICFHAQSTIPSILFHSTFILFYLFHSINLSFSFILKDKPKKEMKLIEENEINWIVFLRRWRSALITHQ